MAASVYPYRSNDPDLRTCTTCNSRVYVTAMCARHTTICMTCESKAGGICAPSGAKKVLTDKPSPDEINAAAALYDYEAREEQ